MSEFRRRLMMASSLSGGYDTEVEWLGSDGYAFFDTGVSGGNNNLEITICFQISSHVNYAPIYGNYVDEYTNCVRLITGSNNTSCLTCLNTRPNNGSATISSSLMIIHKVLSSKSSVIVDGTTVTQPQTGGTDNSSNIALFQRSVTNPLYGINIGLKVFSMQIRDNGVLIRDYIPVRKGNTGYMYDKVNGTLSINLGTGDFTYGNDKQNYSLYDAEVDFIAFNGNAYLEPSIAGDNDSLDFYIEFLAPSYSKYATIFGNQDGENKNCWRLMVTNTNNGRYYICANTKPSGGTTTATIPFGVKHTFELNSGSYILDSVETSLSSLTKGTINDNFVRFGCASYNTPNVMQNLRIYSIKVKDNGTTILDCIPVISNYIGYMYDRISGQLIGNASSIGKILGGIE